MKPLKKILQSRKFLIFITILTLIVLIKDNFFYKESKYTGLETTFVGRILKYKKLDNTYMITLLGKEKLIVYLKDFNYNLGDKIYLEGNLELPSNNTVLNTFNYKEYLKREKITYVLDANKSLLVSKNKNLLLEFKNNLLKYMDTFKSKNYLKSFILGDTSYLDKDMYKSFQINGICHILSIGSTHITFLSFIILNVFKKFKIKEEISYSILLFILFLYLLIVDFNVPILRVYLYILISFLNKKLNLKFSHIKIFYLDILITLIFFPSLIYSKGFLYSYSLSFLLILNRKLLKGSYLKKLFKISFLAFLGSFPLNIYFNYNVNLLSVFYNLLFVPIFSFIFPLAFLTLIFNFLDNFLFTLINLLTSLSYYLDDFKFLTFIFKKPSIIVVVVYFILIIWLIKRHDKVSFSVLIIVLLIHFNINYICPNNFFTVLDVKEGDSIYLNLYNTSILIDTGGVYGKHVSDNTITMLSSEGIRKIDYLILTHGDYDHMGDSIYLVSNFKVKNVIFNNGAYTNLESELLKVLQEKKINYFSNLKKLEINNLEIKFLNTRNYDNENDNSLVLYFLYNKYKFLLMGDASKEKEMNILDKYNLSSIDFFKVAHHGSDTSSSRDFIDKINPRYSFISLGLNNHYGFPKESVLENLKDSKVYRTDLDGSIEVKFLKNSYKIITYTP